MVFEQRFNDIDALTERLDGFDVQFLPLTIGDSIHYLAGAATPSILINKMVVGLRVHQYGAARDGYITFGFIEGNRGLANFNHLAVNQSSLIVFPTGKEFSCVSTDTFSATSISIESSWLNSVIEGYDMRMEGLMLGESTACIPLQDCEAYKISQLLSQILHADIGSDCPQASALETELALCLLSSISSVRTGDGPGRAKAGQQAFFRARNFIEANFTRPISIANVCHASCVSPKTLERSFNEQLETTPAQYLRLLRLDNARRLLKSVSGRVTVAEVATQCGFSHLGRFSEYYQRQYGELPSITMLNKRQG